MDMMSYYWYNDGPHAVPAVCGPVHIQNNKNKKYINNRYNLPITRINML